MLRHGAEVLGSEQGRQRFTVVVAAESGEHTAALAAARRFGRVVALQNGRLADVPLEVEPACPCASNGHGLP